MEEDIYKTIAKLYLSTRKKNNRLLSIFDIANEINWLKAKLGGLTQVANELKITPGMLNQFLSINKLDESIQMLVKERIIDSVSVVFYLSKFSKSNQKEIVDYVIEGKLNSQDLKTLIPLSKQFPEMPIKDLSDKLLLSKNIRISVIQFFLTDLRTTETAFKNNVSSITGENNIHAINFDSTPCSLKLTKEGEKLLRKEAKKINVTLQELIIKLLN